MKGSCGRECFENLGAPHVDISYLFVINVNVFLNGIKKWGDVEQQPVAEL